jgi:arginine utilization regulatory protein
MFDDSMMEILNALEEGITVVDTNGTIVFCNKKAGLLDNIDVTKAMGRHILEVYPSLSEKTSTLLKVLSTGEPIYDNLQSFKNYKGEEIVTVNSTIPMKKNRKITGALEISRDITEMKKLSEEVVELKSELINTSGGTKFSGKREDKMPGTSMRGYNFMDIIGQSNEMLKLKAFALKAAASSSHVLIYGETGTGKELFVQSIHNSSSRKNMPFIAQNCAALPSTLLEGILFGTVKGSFTGSENRPGLFELANGGTLYLDELNSMSLELQAKLLRVLQDGIIRRVGDIRETEVNVRVITSTNLDPLYCVENNIIRKDLYFRLNVISLRIPELRSRRADIPSLVDFFINKYKLKLNSKIKGITKEAIDNLIAYEWPGNVRELQHVIEGVMNIRESGYIELEDLPENIRYSKQQTLNEALEETEVKLLKEAMRLCSGNVSKAAERLGVPRQTLQYKIKKHDIKIVGAEN